MKGLNLYLLKAIIQRILLETVQLDNDNDLVLYEAGQAGHHQHQPTHQGVQVGIQRGGVFMYMSIQGLLTYRNWEVNT